jgi:hypothetical protein
LRISRSSGASPHVRTSSPPASSDSSCSDASASGRGLSTGPSAPGSRSSESHQSALSCPMCQIWPNKSGAARRSPLRYRPRRAAIETGPRISSILPNNNALGCAAAHLASATPGPIEGHRTTDQRIAPWHATCNPVSLPLSHVRPGQPKPQEARSPRGDGADEEDRSYHQAVQTG